MRRSHTDRIAAVYAQADVAYRPERLSEAYFEIDARDAETQALARTATETEPTTESMPPQPASPARDESTPLGATA